MSILKIVNLDEQSIIDNTKIAVGFGGNHYAHMPTKLTLKNSLYFGHIFPKYQIKNLTKDKINESFRKSNTKYAYIDKKSISSIHKKNLIQIIEDLGYFIISHEDLL